VARRRGWNVFVGQDEPASLISWCLASQCAIQGFGTEGST
jgi:hypothetical protein